ncbi:MAG: serpin family protein [Planctomycetes bacterium]|nr:serpin family protein [Planctomycetota bacterium]
MRILLIGAFTAWLSLAMVTPGHAQKIDPDVKTLVDGNTDFGLTLYQRLAQKDGNLFLSPYSISNAFGMCYAGAKGNTADEMKTTLRFNLGEDRLHPAFAKLIGALDGEGKKRPFQLTVANRLWGQKDYGFLPAFTKVGSDHYGAGLEEVDYAGAPEAARLKINGWVEQKTKDKIKDLIPKGVLDNMTRLVLTNAIYFKAAWVNPFEPSQTKPGSFSLADGKSAKVPMMHSNNRGRYADLGTFSMVQIPYVGYQQSMLVLLPKKKDGLADVEKKLTAANLNAWTKKLSTHIVDLKLPKFKVTAEFKLNDVLKEMGMKDAFIFGKADFSGMATREKLYITAVLHKAFVDVNEAGTEAAASTAIEVGTRSLPPRATFHADRPFLFVIQDYRTGSILFVGRVANPG